jgi:hypothetical protein
VIEMFRTCRRHRAALLDFVDHGLIGPPTAEALAHLEGCDSCTEMLDSAVLAIAALRRLGDEAGRMEPPADSWPRLRARLTTRRPGRISIVSPLGGTVMTVALAAILVAPLRLSHGPATDELGAVAASSDPTSSAAVAVYTRSARRVTDGSNSPDSPKARAEVRPRPIYPDGGRPADKEVPATHSIVRPTEPR